MSKTYRSNGFGRDKRVKVRSAGATRRHKKKAAMR